MLGNIDYKIESSAFYGESGNGVVIVATETGGSSIFLEPEVRLYAPSGVLDATAWDYTQAMIDDHNLAETGWYTIVVKDYGGNDAGILDFSFAKMPPTLPPIMNPNPANGDTVDIAGIVLNWDDNWGAIAYDIHFGSGGQFPLPMVAESLTANSYPLPPQEYDTYYFWYIMLKYDNGEEIQGPYWWFLTYHPHPFITDLDIGGSEDIGHLVTHHPLITWSYSDPETLAQTAYQVQVGTDDDWAVAEM